MLTLKPGVRVVGLKPELLIAFVVADGVYASYGLECVVTSVVDSKHSIGSKHYAGYAMDLRTHHVPADSIKELHRKIQNGLGGDYDVVLESDHIHIEYDPKQPLAA